MPARLAGRRAAAAALDDDHLGTPGYKPAHGGRGGICAGRAIHLQAGSVEVKITIQVVKAAP